MMTRKWARFAIAAVCALSVMACGSDTLTMSDTNTVIVNLPTGGTPPGGPSIVSVGLSALQLFHGTCGPQSGTVSVTTNPAGAGIVITSSNTSVVRVSGNTYTEVGVGTATIRVAISGGNDFRDFTVTVGECNTGGAPKVSFTPHGGNYYVGNQIPLQIVCENVSCTNMQILTSDPAVLTVNLVTHTLTCTSAGTSRVIVQASAASTTPADTATFTCVAVASQTYTVVPSSLSSQCTAVQFYLKDSQGNIITSGVTWSSTSSGMNMSTGVFTPSTTGQHAIMANYNGHTYTYTHSVTGVCGSGNNSASPSSISVQNCTGFQTTYTLQFLVNGTAVSATWTSNNSNVAAVNGSTLTLSGNNTGSATITGASSTGQTVTIPVTVSQCQNQQPITVTVTPPTFALTVGQQPIVLSANVSGVPAGQSTGVTWSTSAPNCAALTPNGNTVTVSPIAGCVGQITITATSVADPSKSGSSVGTTSSGNITCMITWNGTTTGTITMTRPNTTTATASCTNQYGAGFRPFGFTNDPHIFGVTGSSGVETIAGVGYTVGPIFTLKPNNVGPATFTVQAAVTDKTVIASRSVIVQ